MLITLSDLAALSKRAGVEAKFDTKAGLFRITDPGEFADRPVTSSEMYTRFLEVIFVTAQGESK